MATDDTTPLTNTLGYSVVQGGLNNQKLALYQALRSAPPRDFAARHDIEILDSTPGGATESDWDYFHYGNNDIPRAALLSELGPDSFACDFFRALVPAPRLSDLAAHLAATTFGQRSIRLALQLRVERDWEYHAAVRLPPTVTDSAEQNGLSFREIIAKVATTLPAEAASIYVICDEAALPVSKHDIRLAIQREFGIDLVWKSDLLDVAELDGLSLLDRSILDFEMAVAADVFVGLSRSTFSNMAALEKYARTRAPVDRHYLYNLSGPDLCLRRDNGAFQIPALAVAANPWDAAHSFHVAQVFEAAGDQRRALEHYAARASRGGADRDEVYVSLYRAGLLKAALGFSVPDVADTFLRAADALPTRAEALFAASRHFRVHNLFHEGLQVAKRGIELSQPAKGLFLEPSVYDWGMLDEYAVNAYWAGDPRACADASLRILERDRAPPEERPRIMRNLRSGIDRLRET